MRVTILKIFLNFLEKKLEYLPTCGLSGKEKRKRNGGNGKKKSTRAYDKQSEEI